jgi:hypothetical protein
MLEALQLPSEDKLCTMMQQAIDTFDEKDLAIFEESLANLAWSTRELAAQLTKLGFPVSDGKIWKHRAKACRCA